MLAETDKYLLNGIRAGDYHAFETLFNSYYRYLFSVARLYVHSDEIAEDLVQDLFVKLWEDSSLLTVNISLKGYLCRSIYNRCINYNLRIQHRFSKLDLATVNKLKELLKAKPEDQPDMGLMISELNTEIKKAITRLPPECGKIFLMSREEGLSHKEIAEKLNISKNTVKVQIYRALPKLRKALAEYI